MEFCAIKNSPAHIFQSPQITTCIGVERMGWLTHQTWKRLAGLEDLWFHDLV